MKRLMAIACILASAAGLPGRLQAGPVPDWAHELAPAQSAHEAGELDKARRLYESLAGRNPLAQFALGRFHQNGWGSPADAAAACGWFDKAAQHRVPAAEHFLGDCLARGAGRPADVPAAIGWYERAASHGHLISWCSAAEHLVAGRGVPRDTARGLALCTQAAQAQSPPAMLRLARFHDEGGALPQDLPAARHWYREAAQRGLPEAQYRLGVMLAHGEGGHADPNAALFWLESAAGQGHVPAYLPTAELYANASPQPGTGALSAAHLAKVYLWTAAARARATEPSQAGAAESMAAQVLSVMPAVWRPALDAQVAEHLRQHVAAAP
jgi:TPR repeat protein